MPVGVARAAEITWDPVQDISGPGTKAWNTARYYSGGIAGEQSGTNGTNDVNTEGTLLLAVNFTGLSGVTWPYNATIDGQTFRPLSDFSTQNGITFTHSGFDDSVSGRPYFNGTGTAGQSYGRFNQPVGAPASTANDQLLQNAITGLPGNAASVYVSGLVVGRQYLVQFWISDPRQFAIDNGYTIASIYGDEGEDFGSELLEYNQGVAGTDGSYVVGRFVANATTQQFGFLSFRPHLNLFQIRDITPPNIWDANSSTAPNPNGGTGTWQANATTNWWDGSTNTSWPNGDDSAEARFANTAGTVTVSGTVNANRLNFETTGYSVNGGTINLTSNSPTVRAATGVEATISSSLAGSIFGDGLTKTGPGTINLTGTNTFTGNLSISEGTLKGNSSSLHSVSIVNNTSLVIDQTTDGTISSVISGIGSVTKTGAGTLYLTGNTNIPPLPNTYSGGTTVSEGILRGSSNGIRGNITNNAAVVLDQTTDDSFSGIISGTGSVTKAGAGILSMVTPQTYTGNTVVSTGTLRLGTQASLSVVQITSDANSGISASNTYTTLIDFNGPGTNTVNGVVFSGTGASGTQSGVSWNVTGFNADVDKTHANLSFGGLAGQAITNLFSKFRYGGDPAVMTLSGLTPGTVYESRLYFIPWTNGGTRNVTVQITAGASSTSLLVNEDSPGSTTRYVKIVYAAPASGTVTISTSPSVSSTTWHWYAFSNQIAIPTSNILPTSSAVEIASGATLDLSGASQTSGSLGNSGAGGGTLRNGGGSVATFTAGGNNANTTFSGLIENGSSTLSLVKTGTGAMTLSGANTFTGGTTLTGGMLRIAANSTGTVGAVTSSPIGTGTLVFNGGGISSDGATARTILNALSISGNQTFGESGYTGKITFGAPLTFTATRTFTANSDVQFDGILSGATFGLTKLGSASLFLNGANTLSGQFTVTAGKLEIGGSGSVTPSAVVLDPAVGVASLLTHNSSGSSTVAGTVTVGNALGHGTLAMSAGTLNVGGANPAIVVGATTSGATGNILLSGGTVNVTNNAGLTLGLSAGTFGSMTVTGGTLNMSALLAATGINVAASGSGVLNISGGELNLGGAAAALGLNVASVSSASSQGIVNLGAVGVGGGVLAPVRIQKTGGAATGVMNFHGGTLRVPSTAATAFVGNALTAAYIYPGGLVLDNNSGVSAGITQIFSAPTGNGVTAIAVTGGTGYTSPPLVTISGGGGKYATAVANIDASGNLTSITVTNPGVDYTSAPTVTLAGGGGTGAVIGTVTIAANSTSGGITKLGSGIVTLSATTLAATPFTGTIDIREGTLANPDVDAFGAGTSAIRLGTASTQGAYSFSGLGSAITITRGFEVNGAGGGKITGTSTTKTITLNTVGVSGTGPLVVDNLSVIMNAGMSHTGSVTKTGAAGTLTLAGNNSHTGNTDIQGGTLAFSDNAQLTFYPGANGVSNKITGTGTATLAGDFVINTTGTAIANGNSWTLVDVSTLAETFSGTFTVVGFTADGGGVLWTKEETGKTWTFSEATGVLSLVVTLVSPYDSWATANGLTVANNGLAVDADNDGVNNMLEFAFDGDPLDASSTGKVFVLQADSNDVGSDDELILTVAVRDTAPVFAGTPSPTSTVDGITYTIQGSAALANFNATVNVIAPVTTNLPSLIGSPDYEYRSFSLQGSDGMPSSGFLRAKVTAP